jgi:PAS domain-containing protein
LSALAAAPDELLRAIFDAYPSPTFLVDADVSILLANRAARELLAHEPGASIPLLRYGEALHCLGGDEGGCGRSACCRRCVVRTSVGDALARGAVHRSRAFMQRHLGGRLVDAWYLVSAAPLEVGGRRLAVLTLEDVTELARLKSLLPMCAGCRKVRDDDNYWQSLEGYLKAQLDVDFTHGFCEECVERLYPGVLASMKKP